MCQALARSIIVLAVLLLLAPAARALTYQIDDGTADFSRGALPGGAIAWLNGFPVEAGGETLTSIDIVLKPFGPETVIQPVTVYLWTDPSNDGDPTDAVTVRSVASSTTPVGSFINIPIAPLSLPVGSWFYAGALYVRALDASDAGPVAVDTSNPDFGGRSYLATWGDSALANPDDLSANTMVFGVEPGEPGFPQGNYLVRVNAVPEPFTLLLAVPSLGFLLIRRIASKAEPGL